MDAEMEPAEKRPRGPNRPPKGIVDDDQDDIAPGEKSVRPKGGAARALAADEEHSALEVIDWLRSIAGEQAIRVRLARMAPKVGPNGENIGGVIDTVEELIDENYLREHYGGGTFQLQTFIPNRKGGFGFGPARTVKLAGNPKFNGRELVYGRSTEPAAAAGPPAPDPLADRALSSAERFADVERARADRMERELREARSTGPDQSLVTSLLDQVSGLQRQLLTMATKEPPKDEFRDTILKQAVGGESQRVQDLQRQYEARLDKMRDDHAAELRLLRENHTDALKRAEDRHDKAADGAQRAHERTLAELTKTHDRSLEDLRRAHEREVKQVERSQTTETKTIESAHQAQLVAMAAENKRLSADNAELKAQIGTLRSVKEKSPKDQLAELAGIKESLDSLTGGGAGSGEDKPWYAQLAEVVGNSEAALRVIEKIGGKGGDEEDGGAEEPAPPQRAAAPAHPPPGAVIRNPADGKLYRHVGDGMYQGPIDEKKLRGAIAARAKRRAAQIATPAPAEAAAASAEEDVPSTEAAIDAAMAEVEGAIDNGLPKPAPAIAAAPAPAKPAKAPTPDEVKLAVTFMEQAFVGKQSPEAVARAAKSLMNGSTLAYIKQVGPDRFLDAVASVKAASPLVTQLGRTFVRNVAAALFGTPT